MNHCHPHRCANAIAALFAVGLASCATLFGGPDLDVGSAAEVSQAVFESEQDLAAGRTADALERMVSARELIDLPIGDRDRVEIMVERCAALRIEELARPGSDPDELVDLIDLKLPQQLSVAAGIAAARLYVADDELYDAFLTLRDLEAQFPLHHGRAEVGAILVDIGLTQARSDDGVWVWSDRSDSFDVLEFLVLSYPSERRCDEAFAELARLYEEDGDFALAVQRHEELLLSHFTSPLAVVSQARIPHLRLRGIDSPEYDRREMLRARRELEDWLRARTGHVLEPEVRLDYADCLQRLAQSDLTIASFYRRIDKPYGARFHASRALGDARSANASGLVARAERFLAGLPEVSTLPGPSRPPSDSQFGHDSSEVQEALERQRDAVRSNEGVPDKP